MHLELVSPCKINLLLNILGKRPDGFHELETVMWPVPFYDRLRLERKSNPGIELTCSDATLAVDQTNLVYRAARSFLDKAGVEGGVRLFLDKKIPMAAGLGGGSGNAATTLKGMNELFGKPMGEDDLVELAAGLGSDVPFFLQDRPALATGRGEKVQSLDPFPSLAQATLFLVHPGFGISTPWAYQQLARFPEALHGRPGRARLLAEKLANGSLMDAAPHFYNSLELPALYKYPVLRLYQEYFRHCGAEVAMMSGSGSSTFGIFSKKEQALECQAGFEAKFGPAWNVLVP